MTVTYNSKTTLERTIESVLSQTHEFVEFIVIDGGSTDGTVDLIRKFSPHISYWHSARDAGISDAFNMGIVAANGRYITLVNSDDWMSPDQAAVAVAALESSDATFVFGRLAYHDDRGRLIYEMNGDGEYWREIRRGQFRINHATVVTRSGAYRQVGLFDTAKRIAMDYDWHLRAELGGLRGSYVPQIIGHMSRRRDLLSKLASGAERSAVVGACSWAAALAGGVHISVAPVARPTSGFLRRNLPVELVDVLHRLINPRYHPRTGDRT